MMSQYNYHFRSLMYSLVTDMIKIYSNRINRHEKWQNILKFHHWHFRPVRWSHMELWLIRVSRNFMQKLELLYNVQFVTENSNRCFSILSKYRYLIVNYLGNMQIHHQFTIPLVYLLCSLQYFALLGPVYCWWIAPVEFSFFLKAH